MQKTLRKFKSGESVGRSSKRILNTLKLDEMYDKFMTFKKTEALAPRTIREYYILFDYLKGFLGDDPISENVTLDDFRVYIGYMLHDKELSPMTVNIRIRTMRAFIRFCFTEGYIDTPIYKNFKPVKAPEDTLESFTPTEIKKLLAVIDEELYIGFRDKVIIFVLLDTMVRISELVAMKRCNVDLKNGVIKLEAMGTKTIKAREVPISTKTVKLQKKYIQETEDFGDDHVILTYDGHLMNHAPVRINLRDYGASASISDSNLERISVCGSFASTTNSSLRCYSFA